MINKLLLEQRLKFQIRQQFRKEKLRRQRVIATQTGEFNYYLNLGGHKCLHMYHSKSYKDKVVCLKFSNNKKYINTRKIWNILKKHFADIDDEFNK